jgi:hypothetical protein
MLESFSGFSNFLSLSRAEKDGRVLKMMEPARCMTEKEWEGWDSGKLAAASHQLYVGSFRVERQIDA